MLYIQLIRHSLFLSGKDDSDPRQEAYPLTFFSMARREFISTFLSIWYIAAGDEKQKPSESKLGSQVREVDGV